MAVNQTLIDGIQWGGWHWTNPTIGYYFAGNNEFSSADDGWTVVEKAAYRAAINSWAEVARINPVEVSNAANATFIEHTSNDIFNGNPGFLGQHEPPDPAFSVPPADGWYNWQGYGWDHNNWNGGLHKGGLGYLTIVHEIGHGLGLAHPHDTGGGSPIWPGVTTSGDPGPGNYNQDVYTVMSYVHGIVSKSISGVPNADNYGFVGGPMAYDIYAIQDLYGARASHTGNDVYYLPQANRVGTYFECIWDTGGTDTIATMARTSATINLNAASLDGSANGGGDISVVWGILGGFTIAHGVWIERAFGGSGADIIIGNGRANWLFGNVSQDQIWGQGGNDVIYGGNHADRLLGNGGNDRLFGEFGNDYLIGGSHNDYLNGGPNNDKLDGQSGNDVLVGQAGFDILLGGTGFDRLLGNQHSDRLFGQDGNDRLYGHQGNDFMYGGQGADLMDGGADDDLMFGQANSDTFYFAGRFGRDRIGDFEANNDLEKINLANVASITNFSDLWNNHMWQVGTDVFVSAGGGNTILLMNTNMFDLQNTDFTF